MRIVNLSMAAILGAALVVPMMAQSAPPQGGPPQGGGGQGGETVKTKKMKADVLVKQVDKDGDGKLSKEEWKAAGLSDRSFSVMDSVGVNGAGGFTPQKLGYITKDIIESFPFKDSIDSDNTGMITVEKMNAYEKTPAGQPPSGGGGPGGAPPSGAAPSGAPPSSN
jgi:hypothetical protein